MPKLKPVVRLVCVAALMGIGSLHFIDPDPFVRIVPAALPAPLVLVYVSGIFELLGAVGLLIPRVRLYAAWGLIALFVAVFPANLNMAVNHLQLDPAHPLPDWVAWARLPFQALFIAVVYWVRK